MGIIKKEYIEQLRKNYLKSTFEKYNTEVKKVSEYRFDEFKIENILLNSPLGMQVNITVFSPVKKGKYPGVLELTGSSRKLNRHYWASAQTIAKAGYVVLACDVIGFVSERSEKNNTFFDAPLGYTSTGVSLGGTLSIEAALHDEWYALDVSEPTNPDDFYIADFSSWAKTGQDLDVTAPGAWIVGPYQLNRGKTSYYYLGGTSMASPHVAGLVALMAQKYNELTAPEAEAILEGTALNLTAWGSERDEAGMVDAKEALAATP